MVMVMVSRGGCWTGVGVECESSPRLELVVGEVRSNGDTGRVPRRSLA